MPRPPRLLRAVLVSSLSLTAAVATAALAQGRQGQPARPKAFSAVPGPDAAYLLLSDRYTWQADGSVIHVHTSRLQVNSYLAINRKYGETKVEYDPAIETLEVLANRTVLPSGKVVEAPSNAVVDDQPPAAEGNPLWVGLRRKVIVHTALEPGAVIEEAWRLTEKPGVLPWLDFAEPFYTEAPIGERTLVVDLPAGTPFHWQAPAFTGAELQRRRAGDRDLWEGTFRNVRALPDEPGAPPRGETATLVASACPSLEALQREVGQRIGRASAVPETLGAFAKRAAEKELTEDGRVVAVMQAVTDALRVTPIAPAQQHFRPAPASEVWRLGVATPLELAVLQAAALRSLGFPTASPILVGREQAQTDPRPALSGLDRALVAVGWGAAGTRFYDPAKPAAGGPLELSVSPAAVVSVVPVSPGALGPRTVAATRSLNVVAEVGPDRKLKGRLVFSASGGVTPHSALLHDPSSFAAPLASLLPDGKAVGVRVVELARDAATLEADITAELPAPDAFGLVRLTFAGVPGGIDGELPPLPSLDRLAPLLMPFPQTESLRVELTLPAGWALASAPTRSGPPDGGAVRLSIRAEGNRVFLARSIEVRRRLIDPSRDQLAGTREALVAWRSPAARELLLRAPAGAAAR